MRYFSGFVLMGVLFSSIASAGQDATKSANPVSDSVRQVLEQQAKNLIAAAEAMPAEKYAFKPTEPQMTFGRLVNHIAQDNSGRCSRLSGMPAPTGKLADTDPKAALVEAAKASFEFCRAALSKINDSSLGEEIDMFGGRKMSRAAALFGLTNDLADHYSQAAIYLRLNELLPPTAQRTR